MTGQSFSPSLGARTLQAEEISLSLPTYPKLLEQIDTIRKNAAAYQTVRAENGDSRNAFLRPQVINNLSILGPRGSGKSSILKTLYHDLEAGKDKNILLPPIVPENLENHMTLMSSLLGLLNDQVKQLSEKRQSACPICPPEKDPLEKEYRQLVECYVHLQKPYQDISIQKYSTESDYVRTMSNVFEAGDQFSWKFWNFIDHLLEKREKDALLFVFIDDIDLSTSRCSDVVRTLLGYISHPRVVTVLAGDIEVFGEALTLDFLRQEELLGKAGITKSYTVSQGPSGSGKNLLSRKKELAYEYLKKVMPPMNRHSISIWTLSNRGKFCPVGLYNSAGQSIPDLQALLVETNRIHPLLNGYFSAAQEQGQAAPDYVLYHLFDSTARGLINCYVAIEQLVRQRDSTENSFENVKFTLETIVFSNSNLNALRNQIFSHFLQFGAANSSTYVLFSNFNDWIGQQLPYLAGYRPEGKNAEQQETKSAVSLELEAGVFQIFVYLDWAARLLGKDDVLSSGDYEIAKKRALFLLCVSGAISEKTEQLTTDDRTRLYQLGISGSIARAYSDCAAATALRCFFNLPFPLAIRYFRSFDMPKTLEILSDYTRKKYTETALDKLQRAVDFINVLNQFYRDNLSEASACLAGQPEMLEFIEKRLKGDQKSMLVSVICNTYFKNGDNKTGTLPPLYGTYCKNGVKYFTLRLAENPGFTPRCYLPYSIYTATQTHRINQADLDAYFRTEAVSSLSERAFQIWEKYLLDTEEIPAANNRPSGPAESHCADSWNSLLEESRDFSGAMPIYNFYSERFWKRISDDSHHLKPLKDTYEDPARQAAALLGGDPKEESSQYMEQRIKVLFAIDSGGLWTPGLPNEEDESPTRQIKAYILKQLISSENKLLTAWKLQPETIVVESVEQKDRRRPLIAAKGASAAFDQLKNSYTGSSRTLAKWCIRFLDPLFEQKPADYMTTAEYIYARCVLNRLIWSSAWYGKAEARALLSVLDQATLDLPVDCAPAELERCLFWFHCYCRYRVAELSDKTYTLIERACGSMKLIREAGKELDQRDWNIYYKDMREKGHLEDELIRQIPKLFE